tara:strand:- start:1147 stop:2304 length:1158 start_codon:yes stop_codon:yes gene_type:complete
VKKNYLKKRIIIFTGNLIEHRAGPHATLKNLVEILAKNSHIKIIGFINKKRDQYKKNWVLKNTSIIAFKNQFYGHYYHNNLIIFEIFKNLKNTDLFIFNGVWYIFAPLICLVLKIFKKKYIIITHGQLNKSANINLIKKFAYFYYINFILKNAYFVQLQSPLELKSIYENKLIKKNNFNFKIIPNAINLYQHQENKESNNYEYAFYVGRLHPIKDLSFLIEAWSYYNKSLKNCHNIRLIIAGDGDEKYKNFLLKLVEEKKIKNIDFIGKISEEEKINFIKNAKFTTITSHSEALPTSILESLSLGTPVISTLDIGFNDSCLRRSIIISKKDKVIFSKKINYIINLDEENYLNLRSNAFISSKNLFSKSAISKLINIHYFNDKQKF